MALETVGRFLLRPILHSRLEFSHFSDRVPVSLKVFLLTLAVADDLGAIVIIALFYTEQLSIGSLGVAFAALGVLILMNYSNVGNKSAYLFVGFIMWVAVLKSGVHATLAGVLHGFCIPYTIPKQESLTSCEA